MAAAASTARVTRTHGYGRPLEPSNVVPSALSCSHGP